MFKSNDKSFFMIRKIVNVVYFVLMCITVIAGIVMMASSSQTYTEYGYTYSYIDWGIIIAGLSIMLLGPILIQLGWIVTDAIFNIIMDVKIIRNATLGAEIPELPAPLFAKKRDKNNSVNVYEKLKTYKELCDESAITQEEYEGIKNDLLKKSDNGFEGDIDKIKKLKRYLDEGLLTNDEFVAEKSKILKK